MTRKPAISTLQLGVGRIPEGTGPRRRRAPGEDPRVSEITAIIVNTARPERVILFGSRARGEARGDSDYDFMVLKQDMGNERELTNSIYRELLRYAPVVSGDVLAVDPGRFEAKKDEPGSLYHEVAPREWWSMDEYSSWMRRAKSALALGTAGEGDEAIATEDRCFQLQQAAEKALKAVIVGSDLNTYAVQTRYPGDYSPIDESEYRSAVELAGHVVAWAGTFGRKS